MIPENDLDDIQLYSDEDEEENELQHSQLHEAVTQLNNTKRIRPAKRNELGSLISEFHVTHDTLSGLIPKDLITVLKKKKSNESKINKKARKVVNTAKTLPKPLEKPVAELIKRKIGFEIVKKQLKSWDAVVESHRVADHIKFPLNQPTFIVQEQKEFFDKFSDKTDLELELNAVLHGEQPPKVQEEKDEFPLSLQEITERRKEMAGIRARQSYREAKAYRQSKIKSKKYHRIQKREKVKQEMKDFEMLQKTDPEAALKKLEVLEKTRAMERATLRHRNTGKWAKNLAVRAKYDQETRKVLAEQLSISREATQKLRIDSDDENEEVTDPTILNILKTGYEIAESNPWSLEVSSDVNNFISGFRKYWQENNKKVEEVGSVEKNEPKERPSGEPIGATKSYKIGASDKWAVSPAQDGGKQLSKKPRPLPKGFDIDEAFNVAEGKLASKITEKFKVLRGKITSAEEKSKVKTKNKNKSVKGKQTNSGLKMKKSRWHVERVQVDEELGDTSREKENTSSPAFEKTALEVGDGVERSSRGLTSVNIDPNKFLTVKKTSLNTPLPDDITTADDETLENDPQQQQFIMEAFADDNVGDFRDAKEAEEKTTQPEVVAELPGWGCWGGAGIPAESQRRKRSRFMKMPELPPRKDHGRPDIIINEKANSNIKKHMVKEVPFPFSSVAAFESNIRAPVSREWVPEVTHRQLIRPAVITQQGAIIEPLSDDVLIRNRPKPRSVFKPKAKSNK